ncbi:MAG: glycine cleavage system aminomethyltransferase GcvT [Acidobacteria bacterium]|nr:glycine cleavage system aminomethyltransferase GcvT [Acidobacteriota bacterium]
MKKTPLNAIHRALGARMVDFGGWDMPVHYPSGIIAEHLAVRSRVGLFDVSHMGEIRIRGRQALDLVQRLTPNDAGKLKLGQIQYSAFLYENGTFVDDLLVHRVAEDEFLLVVNASNTDKDFAWAKAQAGGFDCSVENESDATGQVALQGPNSLEVLQPLVDVDLASVKYYGFTAGKFLGIPVLLARTGYTGEDGFEVYCAAERTPFVWDTLAEGGQPFGLAPAGLGCRNTLRLEAKMALYGHEIDDQTHALEADLGWMVKFDKGDFIGREALLKARDAGLTRRLAGFRTLEKRDIARDGMPVLREGRPVGHVTSGAPSATLGFNLGLCYLPLDLTAVGSRFQVDIRGRACDAEVIPTPFYKRAR